MTNIKNRHLGVAKYNTIRKLNEVLHIACRYILETKQLDYPIENTCSVDM